MTIIPIETLTRWTKESSARAVSKLANLLELREILIENTVKGKSRNSVSQIYSEAAKALGYSKNTLERNIRIIREYEDEKLVYWIVSGLSFDHIEAANFYQTSDKPAVWLLDRAIDPGNETGNIMTVDELTIFANGEKATPGVVNRFLNLLSRIGDFPAKFGWDADKSTRFHELVKQIKEFIE